jgi:membrane fusion protein (multidrug efflux system)
MALGPLAHVKRPWLIGGAAVIVAVGAFVAWRYLSPRESTDDAQVTGHVSPVAARVGGRVHAIRVTDNQHVKAGDVLVEIEPRDYELAVARAEADLAAAEAASRAARAGVPVTSMTARSEQHSADAGSTNAEAAEEAAAREIDASRAKVAAAQAREVEAKANASRAAQDLERLRPLAAKDEISKQQLDAAESMAQAAQAAVASATADIHEAEANLAVSESKKVQASGMLTQARAQAQAASTAPQQIALIQAQAAGADARVLLARSQLDQAKLDLARTTLVAPSDGVVSKRAIEIGQIIQPGQPLMAITSLSDVWVTANFKETQLADMKVGQRAAISVDAYDGRAYAGHVDSIAAATGATFSLLPPDNATGNFVKVVQRIPVKILIEQPGDGTSPLRPGMSVNATVYLH